MIESRAGQALDLGTASTLVRRGAGLPLVLSRRPKRLDLGLEVLTSGTTAESVQLCLPRQSPLAAADQSCGIKWVFRSPTDTECSPPVVKPVQGTNRCLSVSCLVLRDREL